MKNFCFQIVVLEKKLLRVPWTARRSNQSILKEINSEYSLERLMLKLKDQYFGPLMRRSNSSEKTLILEKIEGRRRGRQRTRWLDEQTQGDREGQGSLVCCSPWGHKELDMTERLNNNNNCMPETVQGGGMHSHCFLGTHILDFFFFWLCCIVCWILVH